MNTIPASDFLVVLVTTPSPEVAASLARDLVEAGLAACGNVVPGLRSIYRWEGKVCDDPETLLILKTRRELFEALRAKVLAGHPYQCPEVIGLTVAEGHGAYLDWIRQSTQPTSG